MITELTILAFVCAVISTVFVWLRAGSPPDAAAKKTYEYCAIAFLSVTGVLIALDVYQILKPDGYKFSLL